MKMEVVVVPSLPKPRFLQQISIISTSTTSTCSKNQRTVFLTELHPFLQNPNSYTVADEEQWSLFPFEYWIEGTLFVEPSVTLPTPSNFSFSLSSFTSDQPSFSLLQFLLEKISWKSSLMATVISTSLSQIQPNLSLLPPQESLNLQFNYCVLDYRRHKSLVSPVKCCLTMLWEPQLKDAECQLVIEDALYMIILYKFSEIRVPLVPDLCKCLYNSRLEILPTKDWELESIHSIEVLEMVREHLGTALGWKTDYKVSSMTPFLESHLISKWEVENLWEMAISKMCSMLEDQFYQIQTANHLPPSAPHSTSLILDPFPPSQAFFNTSMTQYFLLILKFLSRTQSLLMMNLYPYYLFMENKGVMPLDNSLFKPLTPSEEIVDPNVLLHYTNVYDAMIDSAYFSMKNFNITDVVVLLSETSWPSKGDSKGPYATSNNADTYNLNLIKHICDKTGFPLHPETTSRVCIYELLNEDLRSNPLSKANWGLFYGNSTPDYLLHVSGSGTFLVNDTTNQTYCIAMDGMDTTLLTAIFSGDGIVSKVSEHASWFGCFYFRIIQTALAAVGALENLVDVIIGLAEIGEALVSSVDKIIFVASSDGGKKIMRKASETLIPVTLGRCGKVTIIGCEDVDVEQVAQAGTSGC